MRSVLLSSIVPIEGDGMAKSHFPLLEWKAALSLARSLTLEAEPMSSAWRAAVTILTRLA